MFDKKFKFSIIVTIFGSEKYLNRTIDSLINQDLDFKDNIQLILVDDGSNSNFQEIVNQYPPKFIKNIVSLSQPHFGIAEARNFGLEYVKGEYIGFLDSGDYLSKNALNDVYEFFVKNSSEVDLAAIPIECGEITENENLLNDKVDKTRVIDLVKNPDNPIFSILSTFIKRDVIKENFDLDLSSSEDILFIYNILLEKQAFGVINTATYYSGKRNELFEKSDLSRVKKEHDHGRLEKFHLKLIENSKFENNKIPNFIQYLLIYDLKEILNKEDFFRPEDESEKESLFKILKDIVSYIDDEVISEVIVEDSFRYFLYKLKYDDLTVDFENYDSRLKHGKTILDEVYTPEIILNDVAFEDNCFKLTGFLNDYFNDDNFSIEALKELKDGKIKTFSCEFIPNPHLIEATHPNIHQKLKYFNLKIPADEDFLKIRFKVAYHVNKIKSEYWNDDLIVFNPSIDYRYKNNNFKRNLYEIIYENNEFSLKRIFDFKFAIVMAIYNTENYLQESIGSVINQTIGFEDNIQLILVNDGSEDSSGEILKEYQEKYPKNIQVITQENLGQAHARNNGFKHVRAKYVNFLDSDDYLDNNALKEAYEFFENHYEETDIVSMPITFFEKSDGPHMLNDKYNFSRVINLINEPNNPQLHSNSAFFKTEVFDKYKFATNVISSEDVIVINKILLEKKTLGVINTSQYFYRKRYDGSSTLDNVSSQKEFFTDKLRDYYLYLFNYAESQEKSVPSFLKYTLAYDLQWLLKEDLSMFNSQERKEFWFYLNEVLSYIDEEMILNNQFIRNNFTRLFFLSLKRKDLHAEVCDDTVLMKIGDYECDNLASHRIWFDIVDLRKDFLNISGSFYSFFNKNYISIEAVKYLDTVAIDKFPVEYVEYTSRKDLSFLSIPFQYTSSFDVKIPLNDMEQFKIKFQVNYHKDGDNTNFDDENIVSVNLAFRFTTHVKLSELSYYKANDSNIVHVDRNTFYIMPSSIKAVKDIERENIELLKESCKNSYFSEVKEYKEIISLREEYLSKYPNFNLLSKNKKIFLFQDRIDFADDNAFYLFKYANTVKDDAKKYFVLSSESKQYDEVSKIGKVVDYGSFEHKLLMLFADKIITTHPYDYMINPFFKHDGYDQRPLISGLLNYRLYFLQHGVTKDNISLWMSKFNKNLDLIVTVSDDESKSFLDEGYGYDENIIQNLGFPRFDSLKNDGKKQILIIPTWRKDILATKESFTNSSYFNNINSLLNDSSLSDFVKKGYDIVFKPHPELLNHIESNTRFIDLFDIPNEITLSIDESYQDLFNRSSVLITDYSSVFFDFAYLKKPVIYYHPSNDDYHYEESYFDYETMGFGFIADSQADLIGKLSEYIENNCQMEDEYKKRVDKFFTYNDKNNCKRVYEWILKN